MTKKQRIEECMREAAYTCGPDEEEETLRRNYQERLGYRARSCRTCVAQTMDDDGFVWCRLPCDAPLGIERVLVEPDSVCDDWSRLPKEVCE